MDRTALSGWASQSRSAPVWRSMAARNGRAVITLGSRLAALTPTPGGVIPVNSPATKTLSPASARASARPALLASTSEGPVPHVELGVEEKNCGPLGPIAGGAVVAVVGGAPGAGGGGLDGAAAAFPRSPAMPTRS